MAQHDGGLSGYTTANGPTSNQSLWSWAPGSPTVLTSSPAVVNGVVYFGTLGGSVYALDAGTGAQVWRFNMPVSNLDAPIAASFLASSGAAHSTGLDAQVDNIQPLQVNFAAVVPSSPAVYNGAVYIDDDAGHLYALDAGSGKELWSSTVPGVTGNPTVLDGTIYLVASNAINAPPYTSTNLYALSPGAGGIVWNSTTPSPLSPYADEVAVVGGVVYAGSYAFDASTGAEIWNSTIGNLESPAVVNGTVYACSTDGYGVHAVRADTGERTWNATTQGGLHLFSCSHPAVGSGIVYVTEVDGSYGMDQNTYALNATTGAKVWDLTTSGPLSGWLSSAGPGGPVVSSDGIVYTGSVDGITYALNATTGATIWRYAVGSILSSPAVYGGALYFVASDGKLHALGSVQVSNPGSTPALLIVILIILLILIALLLLLRRRRGKAYSGYLLVAGPGDAYSATYRAELEARRGSARLLLSYAKGSADVIGVKTLPVRDVKVDGTNISFFAEGPVTTLVKEPGGEYYVASTERHLGSVGLHLTMTQGAAEPRRIELRLR